MATSMQSRQAGTVSARGSSTTISSSRLLVRSHPLPFTALAPGRRVAPTPSPPASSPSQHVTLLRGRTVTSALDTPTQPKPSVDIEQLDREYCDDFVCTSSPAVEQSVRTFMKCLERSRFVHSLFAKDTTYSDAFRSFKGADKYSRHNWILESIKAPRTVINKVQMLDKSTAQINWQLTGELGVAPVDIRFTSIIEMNLVTGRIMSYKETWDLSNLSGPIAFIVSANRAFWSAKQGSIDAQEGLGRAADSIATLGSTDEDSGQVYRDPTDPTKFFQQSGGNQQYNDMLGFAIIVVAMYAVFKGFSTVIKL